MANLCEFNVVLTEANGTWTAFVKTDAGVTRAVKTGVSKQAARSAAHAWIHRW